MDEVTFEVYQNETGFIALDDLDNVGYGDTAQAAIDDLVQSYGDVEVDVFDIVFEGFSE